MKLNITCFYCDVPVHTYHFFIQNQGVGCFETAVQLRKPNIMQLILTTLVDGTLETQNELSRSLLTTTMPIDGFLTLRDLILHHPPGYATDILRSMTFIKVPFVSPIRIRADEIKVRITF